MMPTLQKTKLQCVSLQALRFCLRDWCMHTQDYLRWLEKTVCHTDLCCFDKIDMAQKGQGQGEDRN